jgi:hypothetical protein
MIGRLIGLAGLGLIAIMAAGMIAAAAAKRRVVTVDVPEADEIALTAIFEPLSFRSTAAKFRGGTLDCWYGGGVIDLRNATLDPAGAHLQVKAVFGGCQILVPETWRVSLNVRGLGGIGDARPRIDRPDPAPHLSIEGTAFFGGFGVTTEMPEAAAKGLEQAVARSEARRRPEGSGPSPEPELAAV